MNKKEFLALVNEKLPVHIPKPNHCLCPRCVSWMQKVGTHKLGRANCLLCNGYGKVPYTLVTPESIPIGRDLRITQPDEGYAYLTPYFGICHNHGRHKAQEFAGKMRCTGCQDMCFVPDLVESGEWIITDPRYKKYKSLAPLKRK